MSDEKIREFVKQYIEKMGYGNQPWILYKHTDLERIHCHIVSAHVSVTRMLTRHYRSARGRRHRRTGVSLREAHALLSHAVDVGRADIGLSVAGKVAVAHVVAQYEYNVGLFRLHTLSRRLRSHKRRHYGEGGAR